MDERRRAEAEPGSHSAALPRVLAATRLLGTLRAGRLRVERLAEESLDFAALVRVLGAGAGDDPLIDEVRRTQDLVETRLAIWRDLRGATLGAAPAPSTSSAMAVVTPPAVAAPPVVPEAEGDEPYLIPDDAIVVASTAGSPKAEGPGAVDAGPVAAAASIGETVSIAETGAVVAAPGAPASDSVGDHPDDIATLRDEAEVAATPVVAAVVPDLDDDLDEAEQTLDIEGDRVQPSGASADATGSGSIDDAVDDAVDDAADDGADGPDAADDEEIAGYLPDAGQSSTDLDLAPIDDELDTIHDYDAVAPGQLEDAGDEDADAAGAPTPRLAGWLTSDDDDDDDFSDADPGIAAVRLPSIDASAADSSAADSSAVDEDSGDEPTREPSLGGPLEVGARVSVPGPDEDEEVTGGLTDSQPAAQSADGVTNELAAAPAADDFLFDEEVSSSVGLHIAFERPDELSEDGDLESEEEEGPRLTDDEPMSGLGDVGDFDDDLAMEQVEEVDEDLYARFLDQAVEAERRGDLVGAIQAYGDSIDLAPDRREPFLGRGRAHLELGDYSAAMSDFQRAEDIAPGAPDPLVEMGNLYFARKEYRRAIDFYDQALEIDAGLAMARCRRGICHHYRRNHRAAFQDLQKAYALDPEIPNIRKYVQMAVKAMERDRSGR